MAKFMLKEIIASKEPQTVRLGAGSGSANYVTDLEVGKLVVFAGESRYSNAVAGNKIGGQILAVEGATADDYSIGTIAQDGLVEVTFDGLEATAGTGVIAIGDFVVAGTAVAKGTSLLGVPPKVCKATNQPGTAVVSVVGAADTAAAIKTKVDEALAKVADAQANTLYAWKVVSLGSSGTGAVGTTGIIERVGA
jgi:hypothetical protein